MEEEQSKRFHAFHIETDKTVSRCALLHGYTSYQCACKAFINLHKRTKKPLIVFALIEYPITKNPMNIYLGTAVSEGYIVNRNVKLIESRSDLEINYSELVNDYDILHNCSYNYELHNEPEI